jgi:hypothetical protein
MFDPRIILGGQPADPIGAARSFADLLRTNQAMGLEQAHEERTLADLAQKQQHERGLRDLLGGAGPTSGARLSALQSDPRYFGEALNLEQHIANVGAKSASSHNALAEALRKTREGMVNLLHGTTDESDYQRRLETVSPEARAQFPRTWAEAKPIIDTLAISPEKRAALEAREKESVLREREIELRKERDRIRAEHAAEREGKQDEARNVKSVDETRKEINARKEVQKYRSASAELDSLRELATDSTGASDMAIVFAFMKAMDPESVVREAEYAAAARTGTPSERMKGLVSKWWSGAPLTDATRAAFIKAAEAAQSGHKKSFDRTLGTYRGIAKRRGWNLADLGIEDAEPKSGGNKKPAAGAPSAALSDEEAAELEALKQELGQ